MFDVVVVGYGPVSQLLVLALAKQGRSVAVVERWQQRYPLPRAVCIDHEIYRILCANGLADKLPLISQGGEVYEWFNADWRELLSIDWTSQAISGGSYANFIHQPTLEEWLDDAIAQMPNVTLMLGYEVTAANQDDCSAWMDATETTTGETKHITGQYLVGCDGANSFIRQQIGGEREDRGFEADWLVIDVRLAEGETAESLGIPIACQYCHPSQPTTIGPGGIRDGRIYRRWEFMRLPGMAVEEMESEALVWELLSRWVKPDQVELVRHKIYTFRSLMAQRWRDRRILIAGDAAHLMPPFLGQGLCSGMRDVWNLAWKLALILDGKADGRLLNSYQTERFDHVDALIDASIELGKIVCIPDTDAAAARDAAFFRGDIPALPEFPTMTDGLVMRADDGRIAPGAGQLAPHVMVRSGGQTGRMDDIVGTGFLLVTNAKLTLDTQLADRLQSIGGHIATFAEGELEDLDGRMREFLSAHSWTAMLVRPDFYVYGGAEQLADIEPLVERFFDDMVRAGLHTPSEAALP